ncbi:MAG: divalent-cation tolerance protein CutA [Vicinamibacteria bacterium]|nr:divalent-cation tolerance protein CutA [Vicinamibacteria bacterium]
MSLGESGAILILCAVPTDFDEGPLAEDLVRRSLAACVQVGLGVTSIYKWKGTLEKSDERLLLIKTRAGRFAEVEAAIRACHPYDVPEIVALPISDGHAPYLAWMAENTVV